MGAYVYYSYEQFGRGYIGARNRSPVDDDYFGTYSEATFEPTEKIVLAEFDTWEEALEAEVLLHAYFEVDVNPHFANKARQTSKGFMKCGRDPGFNHTQETKRKIGDANRGKTYGKETRAKVGKASKERWKEPEYREKVLSKRKGSKRSEETKRKMAEARRKFWEKKSKEERSKIANKGWDTRKG